MRHCISLFNQFLIERQESCRIQIKGQAPFWVGCMPMDSAYILVFNNVALFCLFAMKPRLIVFARMFIGGLVHVKGDWFRAVKLLNQLEDKEITPFERFLSRWIRKQGVDVHYALNPEAFECFLGSRMKYTGARFVDGNTDDLGLAQLAADEFAAGCLCARPGQLHFDSGCGWGCTLQHFSERYRTNSHGITTSAQQAEYARGIIDPRRAKVFLVKDFTDYQPTVPYDIATVIGMIEHIPECRLVEYFRYLHLRLRPGGSAFVQCINRLPGWAGGDRARFLNQAVYSHQLQTRDATMFAASLSGLNPEFIEEDIESYAKTARIWTERMLARAYDIWKFLRSERERRILLGYITLGYFAFADGSCQLNRFLLKKPR